jgi:glycosyltransferase involved in cell wall biosynthesis
MKLSIITINLNNAKGLKRTMASVQGQAFKDFEYIIIDGASNDDSKVQIEHFERSIHERPEDPLPLKWVSEPDNGRYAAMNKGIKMASGEYLLFLNSGDYLFSNRVLDDIFKRGYEEQIISGAVETFSDFTTERKVYYNFDSSRLSLNSFLNASLNHQASFIKRSLFDEYGLYSEKYKIVADSEFFIKTICFGQVSFRLISDVISCFNIEGISSQEKVRRGLETEEMHKSIIPPLILSDYKHNYVSKMDTINRYSFSRISYKLLLYLVRFYERLFVYR